MPAPATSVTTPTLAGSDDMIKYMEEALRQLEEAQGGVDVQARAQLEKLRQQTAALSSIETQTQQATITASTVDELVLAGQLDKLDGQLQQLESSIANADPATKEMLSKSTALWLKQQQDE